MDPNDAAVKQGAAESQDLINKDNENNESSRVATNAKPRPYIGLIFSLLSAFFLSTSNIFARKAVFFAGVEITFVSFLLMLSVMMFMMIRSGKNLLGPKGHRCLLILRSLMIIIAIVFMKSSVKLISPSDATAIFHTNVILVAILSRFLFKEILSFIHVFCLFIAILGNIGLFKKNIFINLIIKIYLV